MGPNPLRNCSVNQQSKLPGMFQRLHQSKNLRKTKKLNSGPSLHRLESLNVHDWGLSSPRHDHIWATKQLAEFGPVGYDSFWNDEQILALLPHAIAQETNVLDYLTYAFLRKVMRAGVFLCLKSTGSESEPVLTGVEGLPWIYCDRSSSGIGGRPDRDVSIQ